MIEQDKLYRVALKVSKSIKSKTMVEIYREFLGYLKKAEKYSPYFKLFKPKDLFKTLIYLYSINKKLPEELTYKLLDNITFISFIVTDNDPHVESCDYCGGDGYTNCERCDGNGNTDCDACDGSGEVDCSSCEGRGCEDCDEKGVEECGDCDGEGSRQCGWCGGDGQFECGDCEGGEVESETQKIYHNYFIISWNPELNKIAKDLIELEKPFMNVDEFFDKYDKSILILSNHEEHGELNDLENGMVYFYNATDDPNLQIDKGYFYTRDRPIQYM